MGSLTVHLSPVDWLIIAAFLLLSVGVGLWARRRANESTSSYFRAGGSLPWWLLGTSIVATTFAADTPLAISGFVVNGGNAMNWFWWCQVPMVMAAVFFFAHLWRRANPMTDMELISLRYSGGEARFLRGFKAAYLALLYGTFVMGWVIKAMVLLLEVVFPGVDPMIPLISLVLITILYTSLGGIWGVVVTDFIQFWIAMAGCIWLAWAAMSHVGGPFELTAKLADVYGNDEAAKMLNMIPSFDEKRDFGRFALYLLMAWWAVGFTDGGSYHAQRLLSARSEYDARLGYFWYGIANFALRMWPWILVGICAAVMFPILPDPETGKIDGKLAESGYVRVMVEVLGPGWLGVMVATFFAAFMSTISTQINLGASYLMNDLYKPFVAPKESEKHYLRISVEFTILMGLLGILFSMYQDSISNAWLLLGAMNGGIGAIYILRWYWHRISAWSEIACLWILIALTPFTVFGERIGTSLDWKWLINLHEQFGSLPFTLLVTVPIAVGGAVLVTLFTRPVDRKLLLEFEEKVQAGGPGWRAVDDEIRQESPGWKPRSPLVGRNFLQWGAAVAAIYCFLIGVGKAVLGDVPGVEHLLPSRVVGVALLILGIALTAALVVSLKREEHRRADNIVT